MNSKDFYRKEALASLSSPEQVDKVIVVTDPKGWLALIAIMVIIAVFVNWSINGEVYETINGEGVLINTGGRTGAFCMESGIVKDIKVELNDLVTEGQDLIVLSQPQIENDMIFKEGEINLLKSIKNPSSVEIEKIKELEYDLSQIKRKYDMTRLVKSPISGIVTSFVPSKGDVVEKGMILSVIEPNAPLEAIVYIPINDAKKIKPDMKVHISPSTANKEGYGFMLGHVSHIRDYPAGKGRLLSVLKNDALADMFSKDYPMEIHIEIEKDENTVSGYKWSSSKGPDSQLNSGTLCSVTIITREYKPMELVFPRESR